jgi:hypothetical protein
MEQSEGQKDDPSQVPEQSERQKDDPSQVPETKEDPYNDAGFKECFRQLNAAFGPRFNSLCVIITPREKEVAERVFNVDLKSGKPDQSGVSYKPSEVMEELKAREQEMGKSTDYTVTAARVKEVTLPGNGQKKIRLSYDLMPRRN